MAFTVFSHSQRKKKEESSISPLPDEQFDLVMCFGTFDIFHPGHEFYLSESQKFARDMIIVVARDHRVAKNKWRHSSHTEKERLETVKKNFPDAKVILGDDHDIFAPIYEYHPDILAFWYDQYAPEERIRVLFPDITIVRIPWYDTERYKSSILRTD